MSPAFAASPGALPGAPLRLHPPASGRKRAGRAFVESVDQGSQTRFFSVGEAVMSLTWPLPLKWMWNSLKLSSQ